VEIGGITQPWAPLSLLKGKHFVYSKLKSLLKTVTWKVIAETLSAIVADIFCYQAVAQLQMTCLQHGQPSYGPVLE
jgi:hypothetical protein